MHNHVKSNVSIDAQEIQHTILWNDNGASCEDSLHDISFLSIFYVVWQAWVRGLLDTNNGAVTEKVDRLHVLK